MDDVRLGRAIRAIRLRGRLRQADVARIAGLSQPAISNIERGHAGTMSLRSLRAIAAALGAEASVEIRWRSGDVDRLLDERHAALVRAAVELLVRRGWHVATEATYSQYGERGAYDVLAVHEDAGVALAVVAKTRLVSLEATLRKLDEKARLALTVAADRFAIRPRSATPLLVVPEGSVSRRAVATHDTILGRALPLRGAAARAWLAAPDATARGILLVLTPVETGGARRASDHRVSARGLRDAPSVVRTQPVKHELRPADHRLSPRADTRRSSPISQSRD